MRWFAPAVGAALAVPAAADDLQVQRLSRIKAEDCLDGRVCPTVAGRHLRLGDRRVAIVDETVEGLDTLLCEKRSRWRCLPIRLGTAQGLAARASDLVESLVSTPRVEIGDVFGLLVPAPGRPRTCGEEPSRSCHVQPFALFLGAPGERKDRRLHRRFRLVEQDEQVLVCGDDALRACERMSAAGWVALAASLRPSPAAPPLAASDIGEVAYRRGRRGGAAAAGEGEPAGWTGGAVPPLEGEVVDLPDAPDPADLGAALADLRKRARHCLGHHGRAEVVVSFDGDGRVIMVAPDDRLEPQRACLDRAAFEVRFPRSRQTLNTVGLVLEQ